MGPYAGCGSVQRLSAHVISSQAVLISQKVEIVCKVFCFLVCNWFKQFIFVLHVAMIPFDCTLCSMYVSAFPVMPMMRAHACSEDSRNSSSC